MGRTKESFQTLELDVAIKDERDRRRTASIVCGVERTTVPWLERKDLISEDDHSIKEGGRELGSDWVTVDNSVVLARVLKERVDSAVDTGWLAIVNECNSSIKRVHCALGGRLEHPSDAQALHADLVANSLRNPNSLLGKVDALDSASGVEGHHLERHSVRGVSSCGVSSCEGDVERLCLGLCLSAEASCDGAPGFCIAACRSPD